jgi:hypothetical protein
MQLVKDGTTTAAPAVTVILLDWSVRERFHALDWLAGQNVPRDRYEIIWIELYDRVAPEVMEKADVVITCGQRGIYHKHVGYNIGLLHARGELVTISDSDAVYPPDFVRSILRKFEVENDRGLRPLVLMHYEWRTGSRYPDDLADFEQLADHEWLDLWPNVGACMTVRKEDAIRLGGFDEHSSFRGYLCGPYDLGWRLVNAGIPEEWHDESVALWHFAHPDPVAQFGKWFSSKRHAEIRHPHIDHHAMRAVEAFSTGRILPLVENEEIFRLRMASRLIGTPFERRYANWTGPKGFTRWQMVRLRLALRFDPYWKLVHPRLVPFLRRVLPDWLFRLVRGVYRCLLKRDNRG